MSDTYFLIVGIILLSFGILAVIAIIYNKLSCTEKVTATICKVNKSKFFWKGKNIISYQPVFEYKHSGNDYKTTATFSTHDKSKYQYQSKMDILINPKKPNLIYVKKRIGLFISAIVDIAFGIALIVLYFV